MGSIVKRTTVNGTNTYIEEILLNADTIENANSADSFDNRLGGAQPNTAMEIAAKLKAAWPIMLVGIALLIGSGALFYFGWYTKGVIALGLAITAFCLYYVIPQYAGAIALGALGLFALLSALVLWIHFYTKWDSDRNWIPDALEGKKGKVAVDTTTHVEGETK